MANVKAQHPARTSDRIAEWRLMRDAVSGESAIKAAGETYLPKPGGFNAQADGGTAMYAAYMKRAQFPEILAPSIAAMVGIAHAKEIDIQMPDAMRNRLWENADGDNLPLEAFHRRITRQLLITGRYGVLADAPSTGGDPVLAGYSTEAILNWDDDFFVLDESGPVRSGFEWVEQDQQRVLLLADGRYVQQVYVEGQLADTIEPRMRGGGALNFVPFVIASAQDVSAQVQTPPLIGVARAAKAIYQLSADYRWQLFMSGQETLVAINGEAPSKVGAGVVHTMIGSEQQTPDLKYVSPSCSGIEAHLKAMEDNRTAAIQAGARLLEQSDQVQESGNARKLRFASETATLGSIVASSCGLLEASLRNVATMEGLNPDDVVVTPPKDLLDNTMTAQDLAALWGIVELGGMSFEDYYAKGQAGGLFSSERDAQEALGLIRQDGMDTGEAL